MSSIVSLSQRKTIAEKQAILAHWQQSGISAKEIAHQYGISIGTLQYWKKQFTKGKAPSKRKSDFVALELEALPPAGFSPFADLTLSNGARIQLYHPVTPAFLKELLF